MLILYRFYKVILFLSYFFDTITNTCSQGSLQRGAGFVVVVIAFFSALPFDVTNIKPGNSQVCVQVTEKFMLMAIIFITDFFSSIFVE